MGSPRRVGGLGDLWIAVIGSDVVCVLMTEPTSGVIALLGGGPFTANDDIERRLLEGRSEVTVVPTADAFEQPEVLIESARAWGERLGVGIRPLMAITRPDASNAEMIAAAAEAETIWLVGDSPIHLRAVMTGTELWAAITGVLDRGGVLAGVAGSAAALCDPMTDPRGGALTIGLGLVSPLAVFTETESWSPERLHRSRQLAGGVTVAEFPTGSGLVARRSAGSLEWETVGEVTVHGDLPS